MSKRIGKDGFEYWDGFDADDFNRIESLSSPWQRYFINRVKSTLDNKKWTQSELCKNADKTISTSLFLDSQYRLLRTTLSQYINAQCDHIRPASIDCVIALSETLGVSIDYLLGIDIAENKEKTDIINATGLSSSSIDALSSNRLIQNFLNYALTSPLSSYVYQQIQNITISERLVHDFMNAYSYSLRAQLESVIDKYNNISFAFNRNQDTFRKLLIDQLPLNDISPLEDFLKVNLSEDRNWQVHYQTGDNPSEQVLYETFISDTVLCIFDIANYKGNEDYYFNELSHSFISLVKDYSKKRNGTD